MNKIFIITALFILSAGISCASCPIDGLVCSASDAARIREPYKPIYNDYGRSADFGGEPFVRIAPADRSNVERSFKDHNQLQNQNQYKANCQFGVCLPSDMSNNSMQ